MTKLPPPPRFLDLTILIVLLPLLLTGCPPPQPEDEDERLAAIITDPDVTTFDYDSAYHAPHVLFPGMGEHSRNPMYVAFHGIPNQDELLAPFRVETGLTGIVDIQNVANYGGDPDTGYSFSADLSVSGACVPTDDCPAHVVDLQIEEDQDPPAWVKKPDFYVPVPYSPQVVNYVKDHATDYDEANENKKPGAITFTPTMVLPHMTDVFPSRVIPAGRFAYVTIRGGAVASVDTSPPNPGQDPDTTGGEESLQQSAHIDLAAIADGESKLDLFAGNGNGTLEDRRVRDTDSAYLPRAICAADFDLDGDIDVAVANEHGTSPENQAEVKIFWGDGTPDGYMSSDAYELDPLDKPAAIAAGDMDGDGAPDLLVTDRDASDSDYDDVTLLMNGIRINQGFSSAVGFDLGGGDFRAIVTGSFEADDDLDAVVANHEDDRVTVLTGAGNGSFDGAFHVAVGDGPVDLVVGDFSQNDMEADLAVLNAGSRTVSILQGDYGETALFTLAGTLTLPVGSGAEPVAIVTGPFNGSVDERMDLAILVDDVQGNADKLVVYYANGDYSFADPPQVINLPTNCNPTDLVTGTFNEDHYPDVAVTCSSPAQVRVYRGGLDGTGGFYLSSFKTADAGVVAMTVEQFDTQYQDFIYLPEGRNAGYGAVIWSHPLDQYGQPTSGTRHFLFVSNHTVDPDSVGDFEDCQFEGAHLLDEETGIPVGHTVSVYEINPEPFAPTSWRTTNDVLMATLDMDVSGEQEGEGCGPQGLAIHTDPGQDDYLYVANAYSGSVTPVNLQTLFDSLLDDYDVHDPPADPKVPITTGVEQFIVVGPRTKLEPGASWVPPYDHLVARGLAPFVDNNSQAWRLAASVSGYMDETLSGTLTYPGAVALLDTDDRASDPSPSFNSLLGHVFVAGGTREFGEFMVGLAPTRDYERWVFVNQGALPTDPAGESSLFFFDGKANYGVELPLGEGLVSGSVALSYDGQRAYVARAAGEAGDPMGVVVVDLRPWVLNSQRIIGSLGQETGVSHVAVLSDPGNNVYKIYQSNVDDESQYPKMGVWVMPEPLVLPYQPARLVSGLDVTGSYSERELVQRSYALQGPEIRADDTLGDKISMTILPDANRDGALGGPDFDFGEIGTMDMEYGTDNGETIIILKNETWLTNNDFQDLTPTWSPEPFGAESEYKIIFSSERKCDKPGCSPGYCPDACARAPEGQETRNLDLFVMDEDLDQVKQLDLPDTALYNEADADWGIDGDTGEWVVVFKREPNSACTECEPVSTLWKATYNTATDTLSNLTQVTDPDISGESERAPFGDYDPMIDDAGETVVFIRHLDNSVIQGEPVGDYDVFKMDLQDPLGTTDKLTGECDGVDEIGGSCNPDFFSAEFTPVWSPDPGAPAAGPHIAFVVWSTNNEDHEDIFIPDAGTVDPYKMDDDDPPNDIDSHIDTGPFWHPRAFGADPNYTGPNLLFDRKVLAAEEQAVYLEKLLMK